MDTVDDPVLGRCTVVFIRPGAKIWPLAFIAMAIAGPCILAVWLLGIADHLDARLIIIGFLGTFMVPTVPASVEGLRRPYYARIGPNGFATPTSGPVLWRDVAGYDFEFYWGKLVRLVIELSKPRPLSFSARLSYYIGLLDLDADRKLSLPLSGSTLPKEELLALFLEHLEENDAAKAASPYWPT